MCFFFKLFFFLLHVHQEQLVAISVTSGIHTNANIGTAKHCVFDSTFCCLRPVLEKPLCIELFDFIS